MLSQRRNRKKPKARGSQQREPKRRILVVCEGEVTEPEYIRGFERWRRAAIVEVEIDAEHGVPLTLVKTAKKRKQEARKRAQAEHDINLDFDEVWCVFDFDDHPHLPDAIQMARDNAIELAISNPSVELWLLLHFRENPGMQHRDTLRGMLKKYLPGYDKHVEFEKFKSGYDKAVDRARKMDNEAVVDGEEHRNPTTGVYRLTESISRG